MSSKGAESGGRPESGAAMENGREIIDAPLDQHRVRRDPRPQGNRFRWLPSRMPIQFSDMPGHLSLTHLVDRDTSESVTPFDDFFGCFPGLGVETSARGVRAAFGAWGKGHDG